MYWDILLNPKRFRDYTTVVKSPSDNRSPFKKDFDTVCNSTILRRLQDKAQVFPLEQEDYARTRLTHSIEVMSIAESLGFQVVDAIYKMDSKYTYKSKDQKAKESADELIKGIPYILKTAALLHDMGNPPFGHLGERIIGDWFKNNLDKLVFDSERKLVFNAGGESKESLAYLLKGERAKDLENFDGNAQLFRLVTKLSLVVDEYGMNLTFPVMATFIKYPASSTKITGDRKIYKKLGYFTSEKDKYEAIQSMLGLESDGKPCRHPLVYLLEAADDIAYLTADIEDAHKKRLLSIDKLINYLSFQANDNTVRKVLDAITQYTKQAKDMKYQDVEGYVIHRIRVLIKGYMIDSINQAFEQNYYQIMEGTFENELIAVSTSNCIASILRTIEKENIYYCTPILKNKTRANAVLTKLLDTFVPAIVNWKEDVDLDSDSSNNLIYLSLSTNYKYICESANQQISEHEPLSDDDKENILYNKILLATDQISGMTDRHALSIYKMLTAN